MVGCVIVKNDKIIGEGYTSPYGGNHAEVNAIGSVNDKSQLKEATLYVTLEPCSHFGKTPPCVDKIIEHQIPNVVMGIMDPHEKVFGKGIEKLKSAGCNVIVGILEDECKRHHKRFLTSHLKKRPYIILKWAETSDGFIAPTSKKNKRPVWITNEFSRQLVHKWRSEEQSILVGGKTVLEDNPSLDVRDWTGKNPIRVVIDKHKTLNGNHKIFDGSASTLVLTDHDLDFDRPLARQVCTLLYEQNIHSLIVEGGSKTIQHFLDENLWDEAKVFVGPIKFNNGVKAPKIKGTLDAEIPILRDRLQLWHNNIIE